MNANDAIIAAASNTDPRHDASRVIRAPRGSQLTCKSWLTEAAYRMIQNNLDPEVAERPQDLVVYGGIGRAARNWECFDQILASLKELNDDETLLIQSGKPVGVFKTHANAPRVLLANSNLVPKWANWEHFSELDQKGLFMYGQMTAGSWIYIGSQGIVQGTFETFVEAGRQHYGNSLAGKWILTAGLGGMGGAQPLAATLAGAVSLNIECQQSSIDFRLRTRYVDEQASDLDDALARIDRYTKGGEAKSIALLGNAAEVLPELVKRGVRPDAVTDQTSAHDPVHGYLPIGWTVEQWLDAQKSDPTRVRDEAKRSMRVHVEAMLAFQAMGVPTFDYGNNIRQMAFDEGCSNAFDFPGFVPAYVRPLFCKGIGPFRWVALSGDPEDIYKTDAKVKELIPDDEHLHNWLDMARERIEFQGLPATLSIALSSGQSDTASLPSFIASVSRFGDATLPLSRWSRPITTGAFSSPLRTISLNASPSLSRCPRPTQQMRAGRPWKLMRSRAMSSQLCRWASSGISSLTLASVL